MEKKEREDLGDSLESGFIYCISSQRLSVEFITNSIPGKISSVCFSEYPLNYPFNAIYFD